MTLEFGIWTAVRSGISLFFARPVHYLLLGGASIMLYVIAAAPSVVAALLGAAEESAWPLLLMVPLAFAMHAAITTHSVAADLRGAPIGVGVSAAAGFSGFGPLLAMSAVYAFCLGVFAVPVYLMRRFDPEMQFVTQSQWLMALLLLPFVLFMRWLLLAPTTAAEALYPPAVFKRCDAICGGRYWSLFFLFLASTFLLCAPMALFAPALEAAQQGGQGAGGAEGEAALKLVEGPIAAALFVFLAVIGQIYQNIMAYSFFAIRSEKEGAGP